MDAFMTKAEAGLALPSALPPSRHADEVTAIRLAAAAARDEAVASLIQRGARALARAVVAVVTLPARLRTYNALQALSDRELRDIGINRYEIARVFEPGFNPRPANDSGETPTPRAA